MLEPPTTLSTPISGKNSHYFYLNRVENNVRDNDLKSSFSPKQGPLGDVVFGSLLAKQI